jgi:hypothetical protein
MDTFTEIMEYGRDNIFYITLYTLFAMGIGLSLQLSHIHFRYGGAMDCRSGFLGFLFGIEVDLHRMMEVGVVCREEICGFMHDVYCMQGLCLQEMKMNDEIVERMQAERGSFS